MDELQKKNVLLVDDDEVCNFLSRIIISSTGLADTISVAGNGKEALRFFTPSPTSATEIPNVIMLDINMPVMDGFEFLEAFQKLDFPGKKNVRIIVVSSSVNPEDMRRAKSFGIEHYLSKPLTEEAFKSAIRQKEKV